MKQVIEKKPVYLIEQPVARFTINHHELNREKFPEDLIKSKLSRHLADEILKFMKVVTYIESPITGNIYDGFYDYSPHDDPIGNRVYEAYLPLFNELKQEADKYRKMYEDLKSKHLAYKEYYKRS